MTGITVKYEQDDCNRCGGTGMFGPLSIDGGRCFSCAGGRKVLTANGKRAKARYQAVADGMLTPLAAVKAGDVVHLELASLTTMRTWKLWTVATGVEIVGGVKINGVPVKSGRVLIEGTGKLAGWVDPMHCPAEEHLVRVWSDEIHERAARAVVKLKGATVTGL